MSLTVSLKHTSPHSVSPTRASAGAAGYDLRACISEPITLTPGQYLGIPTGIAIQMPSNLEAQVRPRSGLALKNGISVLNTPGTIDSDFTGEIRVILINHSREPFTIHNNDRIAQLVFAEVAHPDFLEVDDLEHTERGTSGFGQSGIQ